MDLTQLAHLGEFVGGIGSVVGGIAVLVTLIYLALQVRQNTAAQKASAIQSWFNSRALIHAMPAQCPELSAAIGTGLKNAKSLTQENWIQFGLWCQTAIQAVAVVRELHQRGTITDHIYQTEIQSVAGLLHSWPGARQWWEAGGRSQLPPDLVRTMEATDPERFTAWDWSPEVGFHPLSEVHRR